MQNFTIAHSPQFGNGISYMPVQNSKDSGAMSEPQRHRQLIAEGKKNWQCEFILIICVHLP